MRIARLKRGYTIENFQQWTEFQAKIDKKTKEYLDILISGGRKELILRFTSEKIKKIGFGYRPDFLITSIFDRTSSEVSYEYVFERVRSQLLAHEDENILNEPVYLL